LAYNTLDHNWDIWKQITHQERWEDAVFNLTHWSRKVGEYEWKYRRPAEGKKIQDALDQGLLPVKPSPPSGNPNPPGNPAGNPCPPGINTTSPLNPNPGGGSGSPNPGGGSGNPGPKPHSDDPNSKTGPAGFGDLAFVSGETVLPYRVDFENE